MTALKPVESRRVIGVASTKYPINARCAHPECNEFIDGVHHCFPRSLIKNDSYFVKITHSGENGDEHETVPHAVGLCGSGTTGHHGDVEEHRAWIKYEDGEYVWYDRKEVSAGEAGGVNYGMVDEWVRVGSLNPQPGSRDGRPKRKRTVKGTEERRERKTVSVRLPEGVDGDYWDDLLEQASEVELEQPDTKFDKKRGKVTTGQLLVAVLERFTGRAG